jgi:hypothetical protein
MEGAAAISGFTELEAASSDTFALLSATPVGRLPAKRPTASAISTVAKAKPLYIFIPEFVAGGVLIAQSR